MITSFIRMIIFYVSRREVTFSLISHHRYQKLIRNKFFGESIYVHKNIKNKDEYTGFDGGGIKQDLKFVFKLFVKNAIKHIKGVLNFV